MLDENQVVKVFNFSGINTSYALPELGVSRTFVPNETKNISVKEVRALSYLPGGIELLKNYLSVHNEELVEELGIAPEPEYYWTESDVADMLLNDSVERLEDCLEFAPLGIINMVKKLAVDMELNDMNKRQVIYDMTHYNVTKAIEFKQLDEEARAEAGMEESEPSKRRVPVK